MQERRVNIIEATEPPRPRKTRLPRECQWVHHEKPDSRAALRRLRQLGAEAGAKIEADASVVTVDQANAEACHVGGAGGKRSATGEVGGPPRPPPRCGCTDSQALPSSHEPLEGQQER